MRLMIVLFFSTYAIPQTIDFPDANFKIYLIENSWIDSSGIDHPYDSNGDGEISVEEAAAVTGEMRCEARDIADLSGIEHFVNMYLLWAHDNQISSITPLTPLTQLIFLNLNRNQITQIDALIGLVNLAHLELNENAIQDISALGGLSSLVTLYLTLNPLTDPAPVSRLTRLMDLELREIGIADISFLVGLTALERLYIRDNTITDITPLSGLVNLTYLDLAFNQISDISSVASLVRLETLWLEGNNIENIQPLSGLTTIQWLVLTGNQISEIDTLAGLTSLTFLDARINQIAHLTPLRQLTQITNLWMGTNQITDVSPLTGLTNLQSLHLSRNSISDINSLSSLTKLDELYLTSNLITHIGALSSLERLTTLAVSENQVTDISPVSSLTSLQILAFRENLVEDLNPLTNLDNLTFLHMGGNRIQNVAPLSQMVNLDYLALWGNEITDISSLAQLQNLSQLSLSFNPISDITPIQNLQSLTLLTLGSTGLSDISALANLANLEILRLYDNLISDVTPLGGLAKLTFIDLNSNLLEDVLPFLGIQTIFFDEIDLNFNLLDGDDCTSLLALEDKTGEFFYRQQKDTFIDCEFGADSPYGMLTAPSFISTNRVWINDSGHVVVNLPHPNIDGWDPSAQIPIQYILNFVQNETSMDEITVSNESSFPYLSELGAPPGGEYFISVKRQANVGGENSTLESQPVLIPGPQKIYGQQIASDFSFIDRWLFHIPKKRGGFDARLTLTNRFPELPAKIKLIGFDALGQPIDKAEKELIVIGRRKEWSVYGDTGDHLFASEFQDQISHVGIFEPNNSNILLVSLIYVNLESEARSNTHEVTLSHGKGGSKFLLVPTKVQSGDTKWDGIATLNMRNDAETPILIDQATTQTDEENGTSREVIHRSVSLGSVSPGGKLLYTISESEFPFIPGAYFLLRTENSSQKIQALALHGGPGFLAVNNELLLLE